MRLKNRMQKQLFEMNIFYDDNFICLGILFKILFVNCLMVLNQDICLKENKINKKCNL